MAHLDTGPARKEYSPQTIFQLLQMIEQAVNFQDENNFPNGIPGSIIKEKTLHGSALQNKSVDGGLKLGDKSTPLKKLQWGELIVFTVSAVPAYATEDTDGVNVGPYFAWDPNKFPGGSWYMEASIAAGDASAAAVVTLKGSSEVGSVQTGETALTRVRGTSALVMPETAENLWFTLKTDNASYAASFAGANLIYVP